MKYLPKLASLWIGERLTAIERLCAQSFLDHGHDLTIYSYGNVENVPTGVVLEDARSVFDPGRIMRYRRNGSPAIHANLFRYKMLQETDQIWVDLDMVALRPFDFDSSYVFGWQDERSVNNAVLRLPKTSPALKNLLKYKPGTVGRPSATRLSQRIRWAIETRGKKVPIEDWPWGSTGPTALTHFVKKTGEIKNAQPVEAFYPVDWKKLDLMVKNNGNSIDALEGSYGIHLWGKYIRGKLKEMQGHPEEGSILHQLLARHGLASKEAHNLAHIDG